MSGVKLLPQNHHPEYHPLDTKPVNIVNLYGVNVSTHNIWGLKLTHPVSKHMLAHVDDYSRSSRLK